MPSPSPTRIKPVVRERNPFLNQLETWCDQNEHDNEPSKEPALDIPQPIAQTASTPVNPVIASTTSVSETPA